MLVYLHIGGDRFLELFPGGKLENIEGSFMHICLASDDLVGDVEMLRAKGVKIDRKSTRLNSSHLRLSRMPSSA